MDYYNFIEFIGDHAELVAILIIALLLIVTIRILTEMSLWIAGLCKRRFKRTPAADLPDCSAVMPLPETPEMPNQPYKVTQREKVDAYICQFLSPEHKATIRKSVYIDHDFQKKIKTLVNAVGRPNLTVGSYVDTILAKHFEEFADEIKGVGSKRIKKIF